MTSFKDDPLVNKLKGASFLRSTGLFLFLFFLYRREFSLKKVQKDDPTIYTSDSITQCFAKKKDHLLSFNVLNLALS